MNRPSPRLPPEMCDIILDHLWDDVPTLAACSLAYRQWLPTTRLHLFNTVSLDNAADDLRFAQILEGSPGIAPCVRHLTLVSISLPWRKFTRIEHLVLQSWHTVLMSEESKEALLSYFPTVRTLSVEHCCFDVSLFAALLCAFPKLSVIHIDRSTLLGDSDPTGSYDTIPDRLPFPTLEPPGTRRRIEGLYTYALPDYGFWLMQGPFDLALRAFGVTCDPEHVSMVQEVIRVTTSTLEHLSLTMVKPYSIPRLLQNHCPDITHSTQLVSLHIGRISLFHEYLDFRWTHEILARLPLSLNRLTQVKITYELSRMVQLSRVDWEDLDKVLVGLACARPAFVLILDIIHIHIIARRGYEHASMVRESMGTVVSRLTGYLALQTVRLQIVYSRVHLTRNSSTISDTSEHWFP
ncbi:hypothetical protein BKA93DRAFT_52362 [Sparassis latifolia]|uniref:F-box domain-containing protein n=1 Tax=Sparassis crispa TaxID=139825 RepID=A0A401G5I4_9APHY|nr:hypothetical protein SCP_0102870 [Sparassis crispa]GBE77414.1 hypothetical protein SCP_0102870 [Sparassis crispa]